MKKIIFAITGVMVSIGIVVGGVFLSRKGKNSPVPYETIVVTKRDIASSILATGSVKPMIGAEVKVGSRISGRVEHLHANIGDKVKKGQIIAEIEQKDLEANVAQAKANLAAAKAVSGVNRATLWPTLDAASTWGAQDTVFFPKTGDNFAGLVFSVPIFNGPDLYKIREARSLQDASKAALDYAEVQLSYATITAPISGVISSVTTQEGETVAAGLLAPTFLTIIDLSRLQVDAFVDETDIGRIKVGQRAVFTVDTYPNKEFTGEVQAVYPKAVIQENVVNYDVVTKITDPDIESLRPDMTTNVIIFQEEIKDVLAVPKKFVSTEEGKKTVYVLEKGAANPTKRIIKTGWQDSKYVQILNGVTEGEKLVVKSSVEGEKE